MVSNPAVNGGVFVLGAYASACLYQPAGFWCRVGAHSQEAARPQCRMWVGVELSTPTHAECGLTAIPACDGFRRIRPVTPPRRGAPTRKGSLTTDRISKSIHGDRHHPPG